MSCWIIPCNTKKFDIFEHFINNKTVVFKRVGALHNGDEVYIYLALPYSEIRFKCVVIDENVNSEKLKNHEYAVAKYSFEQHKFVELELVQEFEHGKYPLQVLKQHGLCQVQKQARADRNLEAFLKGEN